MYIHERDDWPEFHWNPDRLTHLLAEVRHYQGRLVGRMGGLVSTLRQEATLNMLTEDVVKSSAIEGEHLDTGQVRSSVAQQLGLEVKGGKQPDRHIDGVVAMMSDATQNYTSPLTEERLFQWHSMLFPTGQDPVRNITVGQWRQGTMRVISGTIGYEKVHFVAPDQARVETEMKEFIEWVNLPPKIDPVFISAVAHFWFLTIHPFDDGNGRIARAIADMLLARSEETSDRFYSMSSWILHERKRYYSILEQSQSSTLDITAWMEWYIHCLKSAIHASSGQLEQVLTKARFWEVHAGESFNVRQKKMIDLLLDGFEGKCTSSKWAKINRCSQDTAIRDIHDLIERQVFIKERAGGRSTSYRLLLDSWCLE